MPVVEKTRKLIRDKIKELLLNSTDACERVYTNQAAPTWIEDLPMILIYSLSEDVDKFNQAPRELKRELQVAIEIIADGSELPCTDGCTTVEDKLDTITEQIECALAKSETLEDMCDDHILTSINFDFVGDGQKPIGAAKMIYTVTYVTHSPRPTCPQAGYGRLETATVEFDVGHHDSDPDGVIDANDTLEFPQ